MNTKKRHYYHSRNEINYLVKLLILFVGLLICIFMGIKYKYSEYKLKTGNFYQKIAHRTDVNILIVGDSIGAGTGASEINKSWPTLLSTVIKDKYGVNCNITNISMGGNTSYAGYVQTKSLNNNIDYDLSIICYGQNDSEEDFSLYYESIIRAIQSKYKNCEIISILESSQREYTTKMQEIRLLDKYYNIPIADTIFSFNNSGINYENLSNDGVHPSDKGHEIYMKTILNLINENLDKNEIYFKSNLNPYNNDAVKFDTFKYISVGEFEKINDTTYELKTKPIYGIMGIDYSFESGNNLAKIYIDNQIFAAPEVIFNYDFSQRHIMIVKNECKVKKLIKLEFGTVSQADKFQGIIFSNIGN